MYFSYIILMTIKVCSHQAYIIYVCVTYLSLGFESQNLFQPEIYVNYGVYLVPVAYSKSQFI